MANKKKPRKIISKILEQVKVLNKKYPIAFVRDGLELQTRLGYIYKGKVRELIFSLNPNWPQTIAEHVKKKIVRTAGKYPSVISTTIQQQ